MNIKLLYQGIYIRLTAEEGISFGIVQGDDGINLRVIDRNGPLRLMKAINSNVREKYNKNMSNIISSDMIMSIYPLSSDGQIGIALNKADYIRPNSSAIDMQILENMEDGYTGDEDENIVVTESNDEVSFLFFKDALGIDEIAYLLSRVANDEALDKIKIVKYRDRSALRLSCNSRDILMRQLVNGLSDFTTLDTSNGYDDYFIEEFSDIVFDDTRLLIDKLIKSN